MKPPKEYPQIRTPDVVRIAITKSTINPLIQFFLLIPDFLLFFWDFCFSFGVDSEIESINSLYSLLSFCCFFRRSYFDSGLQREKSAPKSSKGEKWNRIWWHSDLSFRSAMPYKKISLKKFIWQGAQIDGQGATFGSEDPFCFLHIFCNICE